MTEIDLTIPDTREAKFDLAFQLADAFMLGEQDLLPPTYIISHKREDTLPTLNALPALRAEATVIVAVEELLDYQVAQPDQDVLAIPAGYRGLDIGVGRARQFVLDWAGALGQDEILLLDDDLQSLSVLYSIGGDKVSHAFTRLVGDRREDFQLGLLLLTAAVGRQAFAEAEKAVIASPQCNNANRTPASSRVRWELNRGGPPAQVQMWRTDRYDDLCGGELDLERFNLHGDDIGLACQIIEAGASIVNIPSVIGQYLDYETESVIRNAETAPALREAEHEALMGHSLAPYVKTRTDFLDRPQWHSLDWRKLRQHKKVEDNTRYWDEGAEFILEDIL